LDSKSAADVAASLADALEESFTGSSTASIDVSDAIRDANEGFPVRLLDLDRRYSASAA
jgi:hypothetical protein